MKTIITYFTLLAIPFKLFAQPGTLDKSFGENGQVITRLSNANVTVCKGLIQTDNKIISIGEYESALPPYNGFIAIRYMPNGLIDTSFGDSGKIIISDPFQNLIPSSACLQTDGKILMTGHSIVGLFPASYTGVIIRLNTDGSLDYTFGEKGFVYTSVDPDNTSYNAISVQTDGKIIGVGTSNRRFVNQLLENGSPDISFGTNGYVFFNSLNIFYACIIQPDGKIVIGGGYSSALPEQFLLKRFEANGNPDSSFGSAGTTVTQIGNYDSYIYDLSILSNGKIIALGPTDNYNSTATAKYNSDGSLDHTFANNGIAHNYFPNIFGRAASLLIQNDNKIILGGGAYINDKNDYGLERLTADGFIDSSFGIDGEVTTDFPDYLGSGIISIGFQSSGKIVAMGNSSNIGDYNVSLARYNNSFSQKQIITTRIRRWLQHHNGLTWDANSNISSYAVQRSYDGIHWKALSSELRAVSNTSTYYYQDPMPLSGSNYYRLQTTSADGSVNYSNVLAVSSQPSAISISPNLAKNVLRIEGLSSSKQNKN